MAFEVTELIDGRTLVTGTDSKGNDGRTVLHSAAWIAVKQARLQQAAAEAFDAAVEEFFKPLTDSVEEITNSLDEATVYNTVVLNDGVEGEPEVSIQLDSDGVILRLLEETDGSSLRWVDEATLVAVKS